MWTLDNFYRSKEWESLIKRIRIERANEEGLVICEYCGQPIVKMYDCIGHHKTFLTEENVNDAMISLNPENIALVHHGCHNKIHRRGNHSQRTMPRREVFLVYGPPLAGKTSYVKRVANEGDLIVDMDNIWQCISGQARYIKPVQLKSIAFMMRDSLLDSVKVRRGTWANAYIIGGYPLTSERERILSAYGAREVPIIPDKEECLSRLRQCGDGRDLEAWTGYIEEWFRRYVPPPVGGGDMRRGRGWLPAGACKPVLGRAE